MCWLWSNSRRNKQMAKNALSRKNENNEETWIWQKTTT